VWNGEQFQTGDQSRGRQVTGSLSRAGEINMLFRGGSFGRAREPAVRLRRRSARHRAALRSTAAKTSGKLVWTREDDMRAATTARCTRTR
jgi:isoquinoline 1-oxidoreductase beta subunit